MAPPNPSDFHQQKLKAWRPVLSPRAVILIVCGVGIVFIPIGSVIIGSANGVVEVTSDDYSGSCCVSNCLSKVAHERVDQNP